MRIQQHQAGQGHLLGLGRGERQMPRAHHRVHSVLESVHPGVRSDGLDGASDRGVIGVGAPQAHVIRDRAHEHVMLLGHQGDVAAQLGLGQVCQRHPAHRHRAGGGRVDTRQHAPQGGLARSRGADDGQPLARHEVQVDAVEHLRALAVGEADVAQDHAATVGGGAGGGAVLGDLLDSQDA